MSTQTAFGGMLQHLVEFTSIILRPEPLDKEIERRCKQAWEQALCPECGETAIQSGDASPRIWCTNCRYVFSYTRNTPFEGRTLTPGEIALRSFSTPTRFSAFTKSLNSSRLSTTRFIPRFEREKPPSSAASFSSGNPSTHSRRPGPDRRNRSEVLRVQRPDAAAGRAFPRRLGGARPSTLGKSARRHHDAHRCLS